MVTADRVLAFLLGVAFCAVPAMLILGYLLKRSHDRTETEVQKALEAANDKFNKLFLEQKQAYANLVRSQGATPKKKSQASPKPTRRLKLVSSGGKRVYHENVVTADFRYKSKKGPDDPGPKGAA